MIKLKIPVYQIKLSEYKLQTKPNYASIGKKLDSLIMKHFPNKWIAARGISLQDHPGKNIDELISIIKKLGTDWYDPKRKSVHDHLYGKFKVELHATPIIAREKVYSTHYTEDRCENDSVFAEFVKDLYEGAIIDRGYALRMDIIMVYDLTKLKAVPIKWTDKGPVLVKDRILAKNTTVFQFKDSKNKPDALMGIIKIL